MDKFFRDIHSSGMIAGLFNNIVTSKSSKLKILCIIPARSGSKGIPDKNIKIFNGAPLLSWSINQAKKSSYSKYMKILVSTDSEKYANIAQQYGAEVPVLRPDEISKDDSTDYQFIEFTLNWLKENKNYVPDFVLQLRPTQPLRNIEDIDNAITKFIEIRDKYDSLRSVVEYPKSPYKMYNIKDDRLVPLYDKVNNISEPINQCRQLLPKAYLHNGYIDIFNTDITKNKTISGKNIYPYLMKKNDTIDIDTYEDWVKAENTKFNN